MINLYKVLLIWFTKELDSNQPKQARSRSDFSINWPHTFWEPIIQKCNKYIRPHYLSFVDYNKAFDSLKHNYIKQLFEKQTNKRESQSKIQLERIGDENEI